VLRLHPGGWTFRIFFFLLLLPIFSVRAEVHLQQTAVLHPPYDGFKPLAPVALAISPTDRLYLLDARLAVVLELTLKGEAVRQVGGPGSGIEQFSDPADLCAVSGLNLFVADRGNDRVVRFDRDLNYLAEFRSLEGTPFDLSFETPQSVLLGPQGDLFIADGSEDRILKIDPTGAPVFSFGEFGIAGGPLGSPLRLEADPRGGLWVLDATSRVTRFDEYGGFLMQLEVQTSGAPSGLAVSGDRVWVASDSLLWAFDRTEKKSLIFTPEQLSLPKDAVLVDLALRRDNLWLLVASGAIHRFQLSTPQ
jgi:hypothetical protein